LSQAMPSVVNACVEVVAIPGVLSIKEFHGGLATGRGDLSAVHEIIEAPAMSNPWRCPTFTEYIFVISGEAVAEYSGGSVPVKAGEGVYLPAGLLVRVNFPGPAECVAICLPSFSPDAEHKTEGDMPTTRPAHATESAPTVVKSVDVVKAPALTITEFFGNVASKDSNLSACVAQVDEPCSEGWEKPSFAKWILVLSGSVHLEHADGVTKVPAGSGVHLAEGERVKWSWPEACTYVPICMPAFSPENWGREAEEGSAKDADPKTLEDLKALHAGAGAAA